MSKSAFDPRVIEKYKEPKSLLHFQWGDDTKVYRYALVEIIDEDQIDPTTKCKREEQFLKKYAKNNTSFNIFRIWRIFS